MKNNKKNKKKNLKRKFNNDNENDNEYDGGRQEIEIGNDEEKEQTIIKYDHDNPESLENMSNNNTTNEKIINPKRFKNITNQSKRLIIILEHANIEVIKNKQNKFELLNTDDHQNFIRKMKKDPMFCRPDILHQCLLMLLDSPLNRSGLLQIYVHTDKNVLIEINSQTRIPRTFKRFSYLMVQLLHKLSIRATNSSDKLMKVIKNPITLHLPVGCQIIGTSFKCNRLIKPIDFVKTNNEQNKPIAIVIGAMAHGNINVDYIESNISISNYPLSAALTCTKICSAFEDVWNII